jgi:hypothetical protein
MVIRAVAKVGIGAAVQAVKEGGEVSRCAWVDGRVINRDNISQWTPTFEDVMAVDWEILQRGEGVA